MFVGQRKSKSLTSKCIKRKQQCAVLVLLPKYNSTLIYMVTIFDLFLL